MPVTNRPIRFQRPVLPAGDAIESYLARSRERRWFSNGGPCAELLAARLGQEVDRHCVLTSSGNAALTVALAALRENAGAGPFAVMPSFAFPAAAQAAVWNGWQPLWADIDATHWHLDPDALEEALSERGAEISLVVALSSFGTPPPPHVRLRWEELAARSGVPLLVDSAAGAGAVAADGTAVGAQGTVEIVSFHATKPFAAGEGGAAFTADEALAARMASIGNFGFDSDRLPTTPYGLNAKMSEPTAAIALAAHDALADSLAARRSRADRLLRALGDDFTPQAEHARGTWQFVSVLAGSPPEQRAVTDLSRERDIEVRAYYEPLHRHEPFASFDRADSLATTEEVASRILSLPMAIDLGDDEIDAIALAAHDGLGRA